MGDSEGKAFAGLLAEALKNAGWNVETKDTVYTSNPIGVKITFVGAPESDAPRSVYALNEALHQVGFAPRVERLTEGKIGEVTLIVGIRPD